MVTSRNLYPLLIIKISKQKVIGSAFNFIFWKECAIISWITKLLIQVLWIDDSDDKPSIEYLYDVIYSSKNSVFKKNKRLVYNFFYYQ